MAKATPSSWARSASHMARRVLPDPAGPRSTTVRAPPETTFPNSSQRKSCSTRRPIIGIARSPNIDKLWEGKDGCDEWKEAPCQQGGNGGGKKTSGAWPSEISPAESSPGASAVNTADAVMLGHCRDVGSGQSGSAISEWLPTGSLSKDATASAAVGKRCMGRGCSIRAIQSENPLGTASA